MAAKKKKKKKKKTVQGVERQRRGGGVGIRGGPLYSYFLLCANTAIKRAQRALQVAEGHQPSAGARSRRP